jgi:hypothetical protein
MTGMSSGLGMSPRGSWAALLTDPRYEKRKQVRCFFGRIEVLRIKFDDLANASDGEFIRYDKVASCATVFASTGERR